MTREAEKLVPSDEPSPKNRRMPESWMAAVDCSEPNWRWVRMTPYTLVGSTSVSSYSPLAGL